MKKKKSQRLTKTILLVFLICITSIGLLKFGYMYSIVESFSSKNISLINSIKDVENIGKGYLENIIKETKFSNRFKEMIKKDYSLNVSKTYLQDGMNACYNAKTNSFFFNLKNKSIDEDTVKHEFIHYINNNISKKERDYLFSLVYNDIRKHKDFILSYQSEAIKDKNYYNNHKKDFEEVFYNSTILGLLAVPNIYHLKIDLIKNIDKYSINDKDMSSLIDEILAYNFSDSHYQSIYKNSELYNTLYNFYYKN